MDIMLSDGGRWFQPIHGIESNHLLLNKQHIRNTTAKTDTNKTTNTKATPTRRNTTPNTKQQTQHQQLKINNNTLIKLKPDTHNTNNTQ